MTFYFLKPANHDHYKHKTVLAGDRWWPRTSGGCFRFARAITYLLRHRAQIAIIAYLMVEMGKTQDQI